jgi:signal recognition particle subunit SRP54
MGMIPGMGKALKGVDIEDDALKHTEAIILSMTPKERRDPKLLDAKRRKRIADGSGTTVNDVNQLVKQLGQMQKMMKQMNKMGKKGKMPQGMPFMN